MFEIETNEGTNVYVFLIKTKQGDVISKFILIQSK